MAIRPAAVLLVLAVALCGAGAAADDPATWDTAAGVSFSPFTADSGNPACVPAAATRNCDPVNVVFPRQTLAVVEARLAAHGWVVVQGSEQRLEFASAGNWVPAQLQLGYVQDASHRFHVRLWQVGTAVIGAVHHDLGATNHVQDLPWETSEDFLATPLCADWCGHVFLRHQQAIQGGDTWRGLPNDCVATVIPLHRGRRSGPMQ